ncbi:MAG: CDP-diacylglycerol--glycerol-3-phosphate 3-phosphatidyltransferase [Candidatus Hydrogenedentota bacterium]|jgi:CDP-diacylglycerol--glycerol-3-phosphate 3-phosphatidyltransferase|uniref:CDP-diacylglycerol--glycerol-3-phosphate 3-phosphatidyltransferase n=1 Tax=Sumerlaea chitinivorans TaxID=2250252 RepID=A0A2Z4Y2S3_SUMC1|nr:CDP-diacylglycerol--glycerol-3-phosphate 3-phosphatidyltransferase [Candidatus Sumerlaea chitinivorans]MCX7964933.1 CDP-diacylglycerol--glycerol-3-phosphate 3-phosphatidyltransferase [Candidatus Sumerlaea chitinivorans]RMH29413.1 MAG: CDP-diacylglycerol--glycerol-3-phosphate 3-phosphatidyltransferase [Candidatus Hydrogenedentota bacterium]GIX44481.1 MAG: CDP-diacylglycerol--glycerol-3-phosphate 3-phosphatidyltransferase [Candidatus Sumerlaea sp.]
MNLANKLTVGRILLIPLIVGFLQVENLSNNLKFVLCGRMAALVLFIVASVTDMLDGYLARRYSMITNFGRLMDPLADKLLTMAAFVCFVEIRGPNNLPVFPAWAIVLILAREFLVTGLRALALEHGRVIQADHLGKHKTIWQLIGISTVIAALSLRDYLRLTQSPLLPTVDRWLPWGFAAILAIILILTVLSGVVYVAKNWDVIADHDQVK